MPVTTLPATYAVRVDVRTSAASAGEPRVADHVGAPFAQRDHLRHLRHLLLDRVDRRSPIADENLFVKQYVRDALPIDFSLFYDVARF